VSRVIFSSHQLERVERLRQEDLGTVVMPTTLVLVVAFVIGIQAAADPGDALAVITSYVPGLSPLVMPVRQAAGQGRVVGDGAGRRPDAGRDRARRPARRAYLRGCAAADERETKLREALKAERVRPGLGTTSPG
jgi:ABC-2 type transport system permease protein